MVPLVLLFLYKQDMNAPSRLCTPSSCRLDEKLSLKVNHAVSLFSLGLEAFSATGAGELTVISS